MDRIKIPTLLGLTIILVGIISGVVFILQNQTTYLTQAGPDQAPKNITLSNIEDTQVTISFQTTSNVPAFITFGINDDNEITTLDDRDTATPTPRKIHHFTLKKLQPQTTYKYKISSGKVFSNDLKFTTATTSTQNNFKPVIGTVSLGNEILKEGIAYLTISGAVTQSSVVKEGNFIIPISKMQKQDLKQVFQPPEGSIAKITIISDNGEATALFRLDNLDKPIGPLKIGENVDLTIIEVKEDTLALFDLDNNKVVNAADYSILVTNFGKNPKNKNADLDKDGDVDDTDRKIMAAKMTELGQIIPTPTPAQQGQAPLTPTPTPRRR